MAYETRGLTAPSSSTAPVNALASSTLFPPPPLQPGAAGRTATTTNHYLHEASVYHYKDEDKLFDNTCISRASRMTTPPR